MATYQIIVQGLLDEHWSVWFEGMQVTPVPEQGVTCIRGVVRDQTALFGLLNQMRDLNLSIIQFEQMSL